MPAVRQSSYPWPTFGAATAAFIGWRAILRVPSDAPLGNDFLAFFTAGRMVAHGDAARLSDLGAQAAAQAAIEGAPRHDPVMGFFYPPPFALLSAPLADLPAATAHAIWVLAWDAAWIIALALALRLASELPDARRTIGQVVIGVGFVLFPPVILARVSGQPVPVVLVALLLAMWAARSNRPTLAGMAAGLAGAKPHFFALAVPAIAVVAGPVAIVGAAVGAIAWSCASILVSGPSVLVDYPRLLLHTASAGTGSGVNLHHTVSVRGLVWAALGSAPAMVWIPLAVAVLAFGLWLVRRRGPAAWPLLVLLASPHALYHDAALLLAVPAACGVTNRGLWIAALVGTMHWIGVVRVGAWPVLSVLSVLMIAGALLLDGGLACESPPGRGAEAVGLTGRQ